MVSYRVSHSVLHVQVDCEKTPEDMDAAQNFLKEHLNCHEANAPGPGGKAPVVLTHVPCHAPSTDRLISVIPLPRRLSLEYSISGHHLNFTASKIA